MVVNVKLDTLTETSVRKQAGLAAATAEAVELDGRQRFFNLRDRWSKWIIGWITALIGFNVALTLLVGLGKLNFQEYQWFITVVTVETFLQVVGLGYVAVRFLFSNQNE